MTIAISEVDRLQPAAASLAATHARYAAATGTTFRRPAMGDAEAVPLDLVEVSPLRASSAQESFCLEFTGPAATRLRQGIHALEHPEVGRVELFIVPVAREGDRIRYEAVFNRLITPDRRTAGPSEGSGGA